MENKILQMEVTATEKELDMVRRLSTGKRAKEVAVELGLNHNTFSSNLKDTRRKFQCKNTAGLISFFIRNGLIE